MKTTTLAFLTSLTFGALGLTGAALADQPAQQGEHQGRGRHNMSPAQASGTIARYIVGPMGHVRGFTLNEGQVVMFMGQQGDDMANSVKVGQKVRVEGASPQGNAQLVLHATVYGPSGAVVAAPPQRGAWHKRGAGKDAASPEDREQAREEWHEKATAKIAALPQQSVKSTVQSVVGGPHGPGHLLLLSDGSSVFLHHQIAADVAAHGIKSGDAIQVTGRGGKYAQGTSILAESLTFADGKTVSAPIQAAPQQ